MGVATEHQARTGARCLLGLPRRMGEEDGCASRSTSECLRDGIAAHACPTAGSEIVHACQDEAGPDLNPAIAEHLDAGFLDQAHALLAAAVELMVAGDGPYPQRCGEAAQHRKKLILRLAVSLEEVAEQDHEVRPLRLDSGDRRRQPPLGEERTQVQVGQGHENGAVHLMGKAGKVHLIPLHHWWSQALNEGDHGKRGTGDQGPAPQPGCYTGKEKAEPGDQVYCKERDRGQEQHCHPVHAEELQGSGKDSRAAVTVDAAEEKDCPEDHTRTDDELSRDVPFHERHRGGTPEDVDMHYGTC